MQGLEVYKTKEGFTVAKLHYTADPTKILPNGQPIPELLEGYVGGKAGAAWRKEMEIDFTAYSGQLLCYHLLQQFRYKIVKDKFIKSTDHLYGSIDWGRNNPASFHTYALDEELNIHSAYEVYVRDTSIPDFCSMIKKSPYYKDLLWISADPSMWNRNQEEKDNLRSLEDKFRDESISLRKGKSRDDTFAINELMDRWDKLDTQEPTYTISPQCHKQVWELERLRYKEISTALIEQSNSSEQLVDKDNHSWDDWKYFISTYLSKPELNKPPINENSAWGRKIIRDSKKMDGVYA